MKIFDKKKLSSSIVGVAALAFSGSVLAVNIGGLEVGIGPHFQVASIFENVITGNGQTLAGVGRVTQINGFAVGDLCTGCELTYQFGGFTSQNFGTTSADFTGGWANFYLDFGGIDFNPLSPGSTTAGDITAATDGILFLTLMGHNNLVSGVNSVLFATGANFGTGTDTGTGTALLDVDLTGSAFGNIAGAGAIANSFFNTNSINDNLMGTADFQFGSSFSSVVIPHPSECPGGAECLSGSADLRGLVQIPEPATLALLGAGLLGFAARSRKR